MRCTKVIIPFFGVLLGVLLSAMSGFAADLTMDAKALIAQKLTHSAAEIEIQWLSPSLVQNAEKAGYEALELVEINEARGTLTLQLRVHGQSARMLGKFAEWYTVPTIKNGVLPRHQLTADDIDMRRFPPTKLRHNTIHETSELIGKVLKHAVYPNLPITRDLIAEPEVIKTGAAVHIIYETKHIQLKATGTALDAGAVGASIRVRNNQNNHVLHGVIRDQNTVQVGGITK